MPARRPALVIVAGPNGCGKSTFARGAAGKPVLLGLTPIDPDSLTREIVGTLARFSLRAANLVAVERTEKAVWRALAEGQSIAVETVLSSEKYLPIVAAAVSHRYRTRLVFVSLPTVTMAIARVRTRIQQGGHRVPVQKIRSRWDRSHANLLNYMPYIDEMVVLSNSRLEQPSIVAEWKKATAIFRVLTPGELPAIDRLSSDLNGRMKGLKNRVK